MISSNDFDFYHDKRKLAEMLYEDEGENDFDDIYAQHPQTHSQPSVDEKGERIGHAAATATIAIALPTPAPAPAHVPMDITTTTAPTTPKLENPMGQVGIDSDGIDDCHKYYLTLWKEQQKKFNDLLGVDTYVPLSANNIPAHEFEYEKNRIDKLSFSEKLNERKKIENIFNERRHKLWPLIWSAHEQVYEEELYDHHQGIVNKLYGLETADTFSYG